MRDWRIGAQHTAVCAGASSIDPHTALTSCACLELSLRSRIPLVTNMTGVDAEPFDSSRIW
jgi:hypothetical protein